MISTPLRVRNLTIPYDPEFADWTGTLEDGRRVYITWQVGQIRVQSSISQAELSWETILTVPVPDETVMTTENMVLMTGMEVVS